jgi:alpha-beta hydrolase superfamily lysophospholipase
MMTPLHFSSADGTPLRGARWGGADRDVLLVHGLAEHVGRYGHVAEALVQAGWRVTFVELRGHGQSGGRRGHVERWSRYTEDVAAAAAQIGRPFVLVAHSMGGLVALDAVRTGLQPACRAVALSNPLLGTAFPPPKVKLAAARVLTRLLPSLPLRNELDPRLISRDAEVVRAYEADPLVFNTITPRWGTEMLAAQARVKAAAPAMRIPLRMMVSDKDGICDHEAGLALAKSWGGPVQTAVYPGLYHELFNEPEKARVLADLVAWLNTIDLG